jgi:hypothetical protein
MRRNIVAFAIFLQLCSGTAFAHGGGPHLKGTASAIAPDRITVDGTDGRSTVARITPDTRFIAGKAAGKREDLKPGDRVVVHTRKRGDGLEAIEVRYKGRR